MIFIRQYSKPRYQIYILCSTVIQESSFMTFFYFGIDILLFDSKTYNESTTDMVANIRISKEQVVVKCVLANISINIKFIVHFLFDQNSFNTSMTNYFIFLIMSIDALYINMYLSVYFIALCTHLEFVDRSGYKEYPGSCQKYVQCSESGGIIYANLRECPSGYFWHQGHSSCRQPVEVPCFDGMLIL